jgi:DNA recombination protein RmuC
MEARVRDAFGAMSQEALIANNQAFLDLARATFGELHQAAKSDLDARQESIDHLVKPIADGLLQVDTKLQAFDKERASSHSALHEHLRSMGEAQQHLIGETAALVTALRAPQARGQWGELTLRKVVELSGMLEHCDFGEQESVRTAEGVQQRPDLKVRLPGDKLIIVDSKTVFDAYLDAVGATDQKARNEFLDRHAKHVRERVAELAGKDYAKQYPGSPDFVVLFLPGEAFFSAACQRDPSLLEFAIRLGVIPASPTTLITLLKSVAYGWQQQRVSRNAEEIRDQAKLLYDRVRAFAEHLLKVRAGLQNAVVNYNAAVGSLESRLLPTARKLRDLDVGPGAEIKNLEPIDEVPRLPSAPELVTHETDHAA